MKILSETLSSRTLTVNPYLTIHLFQKLTKNKPMKVDLGKGGHVLNNTFSAYCTDFQ